MDAQKQNPGLDIGPAGAKLRFFRFAEFVLVFLAIVAVPVFAGLYTLRDTTADLEHDYGSSFSSGNITIALIALAVAILVGSLAYRTAGKLRANSLRRYKVLLPIAAAAFLVVGIIFGMQGERMMHRAMMIRTLPSPYVIELATLSFDVGLGFGMSPGERARKIAELKEKIAQDAAERPVRAAAIEQAALPRIALAEFGIGAAIACALGVWGLFKFAGTPLDPGKTPMTYLDAAAREGRKQKPPWFGRKPVNRTRGFLFLLAALGLIAVQFLLLPELSFGLGTLLGIICGVAVFLALFRAKQYFQVSADSLLGKDKRPPILFLRSFSDDPKVTAAAGITYEGLAQLIDFSVETRLANDFMRFGPFIAIGSPQETVPQIGAARVKLSDDAWQAAVTRWMETSSAIVMYAGTTHWVGWELKRVIEGGFADKLIILFPPVLPFPGFWQSSWLKRQKDDIVKRFDHTRAAFAGTKWEDAWNVAAPETIISARLDPDGGIAFTRSLRRSKDAYDLSAKIAHLGILGRTAEPDRKGDAARA